jgi:hypothetical protein
MVGYVVQGGEPDSEMVVSEAAVRLKLGYAMAVGFSLAPELSWVL